MKKFTGAAVLAVLLLTTPAFAQVASPPSTSGNMPESGAHQREMLEAGRITEIDLANGTVTLDTGTQFSLAPSLQYTSFPALGQEVQVTYSEQDGKKVARVIDVKTSGGGEGGSD
jgi:opacity protein-like surface antigen